MRHGRRSNNREIGRKIACNDFFEQGISLGCRVCDSDELDTIFLEQPLPMVPLPIKTAL